MKTAKKDVKTTLVFYFNEFIFQNNDKFLGIERLELSRFNEPTDFQNETGLSLYPHQSLFTQC